MNVQIVTLFVLNDEIELRMWNQISYDPRSYERNFSNCE